MRILRKITPPLKIDKRKQYSLFTAINEAGTDRRIRPLPFMDFFCRLYRQRLDSLKQLKVNRERLVKECQEDIKSVTELIGSEFEKHKLEPQLYSSRRFHAKFQEMVEVINSAEGKLNHLKIQLDEIVEGVGGIKRHKLVISSAAEFIRQAGRQSHPPNMTMAVATNAWPEDPKSDNKFDTEKTREKRIRKMNELLSFRIFRKNQILPLAKQKVC